MVNNFVNDYDQVLSSLLNNLGAKFKHPSQDILGLNDIFIYPHLHILEDDKNFSTRFQANKLLDKTNFACIAGSEDSGKTTLKQKLAQDLRLVGYYPILVNMSELKSVKPDEISSIFYKKLGIESYFDIHNLENKFFLLIDDYTEDNLSSHNAERLFTQIQEYFKGIYIFGLESSFYGTVFNSFLQNFECFNIQPFGYSLRSKLYEKWYRLGTENKVEDDESVILGKIDTITKQFDIILHRNLVESKPLYILMILQTLENVEAKDFSKTSYGHCYNSLLVSSLSKVTKSMPKIEGVIAFLSYFAYEMHTLQIMEVKKDQFDQIYKNYCARFVKIHDMKEILIESGILIDNEKGMYVFSQKYIHFYCCGKFISDNIDNQKMKATINDLCLNIHNQNKATILIFVTHHLGSSRVKTVLQEILTYAEFFLESNVEYLMDTASLSKFGELEKTLPKIALEQKDIYLERQKALTLQDELESKQIDTSNPVELISHDNELDNRLINFNEVTSALRVIDVLGQIAKNGYSIIDKDTLREILGKTCTLGMKSVSFYLNIIFDDSIGLKEYLTEKIALMSQDSIAKNEHNAAINAEKYANVAATKAKVLIEKISYSILYGLINYTAMATAHEALDEIQNEVLNNLPSNAKKLIYLASRISISGSTLPKDLISQTYNDLKNQEIPLHLMKHIILNHIYLHKIPSKDQQWLSATLNIPMAGQVAMINANSTNNFMDRMKKPTVEKS